MAKSKKHVPKSIRNTKAFIIVNGEKIHINTLDGQMATEIIEKYKGTNKFYCENCGVEVIPRRAPYRANRRKGYGPDYFFAALTKHTDDCSFNKSSGKKEKAVPIGIPEIDFDAIFDSNVPDPQPLKRVKKSDQVADSSIQEADESNANTEFTNDSEKVTSLNKAYRIISALPADAMINCSILKSDIFIDKTYPDKSFANDLSGRRIVITKKITWARIPAEIQSLVSQGYVCLVNEDADLRNPNAVLYLLVQCKRKFQKKFQDVVFHGGPGAFVIAANLEKVHKIHDFQVYITSPIDKRQYVFIKRH